MISWPPCDPAQAPNLGYASNHSDGTIAVVDLSRDRIIGLISGFNQPWNVNVTPDGRKLYVDDVQPITAETAKIKVVDTCTQKVIKEFPADGMAIAAMPKHGREVVTAVYEHKEIVVIDTATDVITERYKVATTPLNVATDEAGTTLWVAGIPNVVFSIDRRTGRSTESTPIQVGGAFPQQVAISPDESLVTASDLSGVTFIHAHTGKVKGRVELPGGSTQAAYGAFSHDGRYLWTAYFSGQVSVIDTQTLEIVKVMELGGEAIGLTFSRDGSKVYVPSTPPGSIIGPLGVTYNIDAFVTPWKVGGLFWIYDSASFKQIGGFEMGNFPQAMAIPGSPK